MQEIDRQEVEREDVRRELRARWNIYAQAPHADAYTDFRIFAVQAANAYGPDALIYETDHPGDGVGGWQVIGAGRTHRTYLGAAREAQRVIAGHRDVLRHSGKLDWIRISRDPKLTR